MRRSQKTLSVLAGTVLVLLALPATLQAQERRYRERQVWDAETHQWVDEAAGPGEAIAADDLEHARELLANRKPKSARPLLKRWLKANPEDERFYEATFMLGETYFEARDFWKAQKQYEVVADNASGELFDMANRRSVDVARAFLSGQKRIVWKFLFLPAYAEGTEILDKVWERAPGTRLGELALKLKADYYYDNGDVDLAQDEYANLAQQYPSGRFVQLAMLRTAQAAEAAFPGIKYDDKPLVEAEERYRQVLAAFPGTAEREHVPERLEGIRQQRAEKDLDIARWYERTRQPSAAEFYFRQIIKDYPGTLAATEARTRLRARGVVIDEETEATSP